MTYCLYLCIASTAESHGVLRCMDIHESLKSCVNELHDIVEYLVCEYCMNFFFRQKVFIWFFVVFVLVFVNLNQN